MIVNTLNNVQNQSEAKKTSQDYAADMLTRIEALRHDHFVMAAVKAPVHHWQELYAEAFALLASPTIEILLTNVANQPRSK